MTRFYIDLEFIERGHKHPIELISIGIVGEDGREFYAVSTEFNPRHASQWVKNNVIACLPPKIHNPMEMTPREREEARAWKSRSQIRDGIARFVGYERHTTQWHRRGLLGVWDRFIGRQEVKYTPKASDDFVDFPEFFGEWSAYDHVTFCQIFGTMMDLPQGFPMRTRDIIQTAEDELGIPSDRLPPSLETDGNHNALLGARTVKMRYDWLQEQRQLINKEREQQ